MFMFKKTSKLENQVQRIVLVACALLGTIAIWASSYLTYRLLYNYSIQSVKDDVVPIAGPLANAIYSNNTVLAKTYINLLARNALICKVSVVSTDRAVILVTGFPHCVHGFDVNLASNKPVGVLTIGVSYRTIFHRIYTLVAFQIIAGLSILLTILLSVWVAMNRIIILPIVDLIRHLHAIEEGTQVYLPIPAIHLNNELGQFITDINTLLTKVNQMHEKEKQALAFKAEHDFLTGLHNRASGTAAINRSLTQSKTNVAIVMMDLDRFKYINDTYGHLAGDLVLVEVAKRLMAISRSNDIVARLGGDEFLLGIMDSGSNNLEAILKRIITTISQPITIGEDKVDYVGVSIGAYIVTNTDSSLEAMLLIADSAMYAVKRAGRNGFCIYSNQCFTTPVLIPLE